MKTAKFLRSAVLALAAAAMVVPICGIAKADGPAPAPTNIEKQRIDQIVTGGNDWIFDNGEEFPGAKGGMTIVKDQPTAGEAAIQLSSDFTAGGAYVQIIRNDMTDLDGDLYALTLKYCTTNVKHMSVRFIDSSGQVHQHGGIPLDADGQWHDLVLKTTDVVGGEHWGGANDAKWHGPMKTLAIITGKDATTQGSLLLADITAEVIPDNAQPPTMDKAEIWPASIQSGQPFHIVFHLNGVPMKRDCTMFVHLLDKDGKMVGQYDGNDFHTTTWSGPVAFKELINSPDSLPDGKYTIEAGLYYRTSVAPGYKNVLMAAGPGVPTTSDAMHYQVGSITIDHNAPKTPYDTEKPATLDLTGYKLTFDEEFTEPTLDISRQGPGTRWIAHTPYWGDFGDAQFADPGPNGPFFIKDGVLDIRASKVNGHWQSGMMASIDPHGNGFSQTYGYFEMRAKLPKGLGTWPAFWMSDASNEIAPTPKVTNMEIDILEQYGISDYLMHTTLHWWHPDGAHEATWLMEYVPNMTDDFHNYGLLWTKEYLIWYFDGKELFRVKTPDELQTHKEYMMVNLALGSGWPIDQTPDPSDMLVKWVRAYAKQ